MGEDKRVWITSVAFLRMLIDGKAKGNIIMLKELTEASSNGDTLTVRGKDSGPSGGFEGFN